MAFMQRFVASENFEKLWEKLCELRLVSVFKYGEYELQFMDLWDKWVATLAIEEREPNFLKRDCFMTSLCPPLKDKVDMAPKKQVARSAVSVDYTCNELKKWYLDIYGLDGAQFHKVHLFIAKKEDDSKFEDVGQVVEASVSKVDSHPEVDMAPKKQVARSAVSVDYTCNELRKWYLDIYGLDGAQFHKVHLFIAKKEDDSMSEDVGQVVEASVSKVDSHPEVECIDILVPNNQEFQLSPTAYAVECMASNKEETMFSRGWKIDGSTINVTADELQSSIVATMKRKWVMDFFFNVDMAPKKQVARSAVSVDYTCNELRKWYLDIYGLDGAQFHKVHLFIAKKEDDSMSEDVGQVVEASVSKVDSHPEVECIDILVPNNQEFQLSPTAYAVECMASNKEETMFSRGWKIDGSTINVTADELQSSIVAIMKRKWVMDFFFYVDMAPKKQVARSAVSVDYTCNELRKWYLDIYGLDGAQFHKVHLFIAKKEDDSMSEDVGQVVEANTKELSDIGIQCISHYDWHEDPLGTPIFPIPKNEIFHINGVAFEVRLSCIQGAGYGLFVHSAIESGVTILHYGGPKYGFQELKKICKLIPRAIKYSLVEDPKVEEEEDRGYILGFVEEGNVSGYINSSHCMDFHPNVRYALDPNLPPWYKGISSHIKSEEYGHICIETICRAEP
ncbi:hypothetical protein L7F22_043377 [Adiantum nelumboides]|nr:hypothetical protein [Adiantum nelumboides]